MAPKKKNNAKNTGNAKDDDFDLDAFLDSQQVPEEKPEQQVQPVIAEPAVINIENFANVDDAAAAFLNSLGGQPAASGGKKKNKKKKTAGAPAGDDVEASKVPEEGESKKKAKKEVVPKVSAMALKIQADMERRRKAEEERIRIEEEERRIREEEERKIREEEEQIALKKQMKKDKERERKERQKKDGTYRTATQKKKDAEDRLKIEMMRAMLMNQKKEEEAVHIIEKEEEVEAEIIVEEKVAVEEEVLDDWEMEDLNDVDTTVTAEPVIEIKSEVKAEVKAVEPSKKEKREMEAKEKEEAKKAAAAAAVKEKEELQDLRSPICVIMGHVDTGKTSLLDKIRHTSVQENEAGGITQQIGATYFPIENIRKSTEKLKKQLELEYKIPGLLVIDTPGHECFTNLRSRGSNLCDLAILVVDIMHLLEPQTIESLNMLRARNCPFVVALNKVDRLYDWKPRPNATFRDTLKLQPTYTQEEFRTRCEKTITAFMEQGLNSCLYYENTDPKNVISLVPTSALTGEGIPDLLGLLVKLSQDYMSKRLRLTDDVKATVLEKKVIEGLGTTLDVILVNGRLRVGDTIVLCGMNGPVSTTIRALLTPQPMRELRTKTMYIKHDEIRAAQGLKVAAQGLEDAVAGTSLLVCRSDEQLSMLEDQAQDELESVKKLLRIDGEGVYVQSSTLGSLEALLEFLGSLDPPIPVGAFNIGPIHKRDVMQASVMLSKRKEFATILAFDVKIVPEAALFAKEQGVRIFSADIIYHLFDQFTAYMKTLEDEKREASREEAIFPCVLSIIPQYIFNRTAPIVVGVDVVEGILRTGTPLCVVQKKKEEVVKEKKSTLEDWIPDENTDFDVAFKDSKRGKMLGLSVETVETVNYLDIGVVRSIKLDDKEVNDVRPGKAVSISIEPRDSSKAVLLGRHFEATEPLYSRLTRKSIDSLKDNYQREMNDDDWRLVIKLKALENIS